jgi:hypothetical protein
MVKRGFLNPLKNEGVYLRGGGGGGGGVGNLFEASSYICNKERKNIVELTLT